MASGDDPKGEDGGGLPMSTFPGSGSQPPTPVARPPSARPPFQRGSSPWRKPEKSAVAVWGRRVGLALAALLVVYLAWGWFSSTLDYETVGPPLGAGEKVLVLLHGDGVAGDDLVGVARSCSTKAPQVTFLVPEGPYRGYGGRVWVPRFSAPSKEEFAVRLAVEIEETNKLLWEVIKVAQDKGVPCSNIYIGGFSSGGRMSAEVALRAPADCALGGVIVLSGGGSSEVELPSAKGRPTMRVLVAHGTADARVGISTGQATARHFADGGHNVRWVQFDGPHIIPPVLYETIPAFLRGDEVGVSVDAAP